MTSIATTTNMAWRRPNAEGRYFFQRFYDAASLRERVLS